MNEQVSIDEGFAALVGIDWADKRHDAQILDTKTGSVEHVVIEQTPEGLEAWVASLRERFHEKPVAVALEQSKGGLIYFLLCHSFITLFPVNPVMVSKFRQAMYPSGGKSDPGDSKIILEILMKHRDRIREWKPDSEPTRMLAILVKDRREAVGERTRLTNGLTALLKAYFPQAIEWAGKDLATRMACDFLLKWPTLDAIKKTSASKVRTFYYGHHCRRKDLIDVRIEEIKKATHLTTDGAIIASSIMRMKTIVNQLRVVCDAVSDYDQRIQEIHSQHPDRHIFENLPGAGDQLAPRLLAAFGDHRERFLSADEVQSLTGIAPVVEASGKCTRTHWRWSCPKFLRQTFHEHALHSIGKSIWAAAYYRQQRDRGKGHHAAVRALAFKWIRILYRCWKDRVPYDEERYLKSLQSRGSQLFTIISQP